MKESVCPYCKRLTYMEYIDGSATFVGRTERRIEAAFQCAHCKRLSIGGTVLLPAHLAPSVSGYHADEHSNERVLEIVLSGSNKYWEPVSPVGREYEGVPSPIASPASEAHQCHSVGAYRAAVLLARAVIEATAKHHGATKGPLVAKIDDLHSAGKIRRDIMDAAHEIRHIGNEMAHGDFATGEVSEDDSSDALALMDELLNDAFTVSSRLDRLSARRQQAATG